MLQVVTETKGDIVSLDESKLRFILDYSDYQKSKSKSTINELPTEFLFTGTDCTTHALMEEIKPAVE